MELMVKNLVQIANVCKLQSWIKDMSMKEDFKRIAMNTHAKVMSSR